MTAHDLCTAGARWLTRLVTTFAAGLLLATTLPTPAFAGQRPAPVLEFAAGSLLFADDGVVREGFVGGDARIYMSPRISVGPEVAFILGENHSHLMLTGNLTCDLLAPRSGMPRRVTPFVVAGGGLFRTREQFLIGPFAHNEGAFTAGGGFRVRVGENFTAGVEARLGWELHLRLNAVVGVRLGDR
jgi:hypothetical protein